MTASITELLRRLRDHGGAIVSSGSLSAADISAARASDRMHVDEHGYGYVWMPPAKRVPMAPDERMAWLAERWGPALAALAEHERRELATREGLEVSAGGSVAVASEAPVDTSSEAPAKEGLEGVEVRS